MSKKSKPPTSGERRNPVAQHAHKVNRCIAFKDQNRYRRTAKHKGTEPFARHLYSIEGGLQKVSFGFPFNRVANA